MKWEIGSVLQERKRFEISLFAFCLSIIPASFNVSFASFSKNDLFLALTVFLSVATFVQCLLMTSLKFILLSGIISCIASVVTLLYSLIVYWDRLQPFIMYLQF